ncbi:MAG: helix-turn-helix domain-containing protein [Thermoplasmatota archaeon]
MPRPGLLASPSATRLLNNPLRAAILSEARRSPGVLQSELVRRLACPRATLRHHVTVLERAGIVSVVSYGQRSALFTAGLSRAQRDAWVVLQRGRTRDLARFLVECPGSTQGDVGASLGMSRKILRKYIDRLVALNLVLESRDAAPLRYHPTAELAGLVPPPTGAPGLEAGLPPEWAAPTTALGPWA